MKILDRLYQKSQERYGETAFGETAYDLKTDFDSMKGKWLWQILGTLLAAAVLSGCGLQLIRGIFGAQDRIVLSRIPGYAFRTGLPVTVILFLVANYICYVVRKSLGKGYTHVTDGNYEISEKGTAREMTEAERKAVFYRAPIKDNLWTILGADRTNEDQLYCMKHLHDRYIGVDSYAALNPHIAIIGSSQSGKTYSVILPTIMQAIRRGESVITTSPKGELYEYTAHLAREHGYNVKVINLNPDQLKNSDSINFLKYAIKNPQDEDEVVKDVISFSRTIIDNTRNEGEKVEKFFEDCAFSLLQSMILYLVLSPDIPEEEKTLGNVYMKLTDWGINGVLARIGRLPISHPAKRSFRTFMDSSDTVRQSSISGLMLKLQIFAAKNVRNVTDIDTVSLTAPGEEKCIYYIGMSVDEKNTLKFLVALYFSIQFQALIKLAKAKYSKQGERLPVKVNFILDEFANCGIIPDMTDKLSVVRSYNIDIMIALQDINQLKKMYPLNDEWQTILSQCMTQIVLKTNDPVTEEFFSVKSGEMTVVSKSDRYVEGRADLLKMHPYTARSESANKRYALTPDEVRRLAPNELLVFVSGYNYIKLHKFGMDRHPYYKEIVREYITDYHPSPDGGGNPNGPDGGGYPDGASADAAEPILWSDETESVQEARAGAYSPLYGQAAAKTPFGAQGGVYGSQTGPVKQAPKRYSRVTAEAPTNAKAAQETKADAVQDADAVKEKLTPVLTDAVPVSKASTSEQTGPGAAPLNEAPYAGPVDVYRVPADESRKMDETPASRPKKQGIRFRGLSGGLGKKETNDKKKDETRAAAGHEGKPDEAPVAPSVSTPADDTPSVSGPEAKAPEECVPAGNVTEAGSTAGTAPLTDEESAHDADTAPLTEKAAAITGCVPAMVAQAKEPAIQERNAPGVPAGSVQRTPSVQTETDSPSLVAAPASGAPVREKNPGVPSEGTKAEQASGTPVRTDVSAQTTAIKKNQKTPVQNNPVSVPSEGTKAAEEKKASVSVPTVGTQAGKKEKRPLIFTEADMSAQLPPLSSTRKTRRKAVLPEADPPYMTMNDVQAEYRMRERAEREKEALDHAVFRTH